MVGERAEDQQELGRIISVQALEEEQVNMLADSSRPRLLELPKQSQSARQERVFQPLQAAMAAQPQSDL